MNEQPAIQWHVAVMKARGRDVEMFLSGLFVDSSGHWLGASPDQLVFDRCETPSHNLLEVKCPKAARANLMI